MKLPAFQRTLSVLVGIAAAFVVFVHSDAAYAQSSDTSDDFSFYVGEMLPNQIDGVTEIMPLFGGRYSFNFTWGGLELDLQDSHANGADWTQATLSYRALFPLSQGLDASFYIGPAFVWYVPENDTVRHGNYAVQAGLAGLFQVKDSLWLRADLRLMAGNVGNSLEILAGIMFRGLTSN